MRHIRLSVAKRGQRGPTLEEPFSAKPSPRPITCKTRSSLPAPSCSQESANRDTNHPTRRCPAGKALPHGFAPFVERSQAEAVLTIRCDRDVPQFPKNSSGAASVLRRQHSDGTFRLVALCKLRWPPLANTSPVC